MNQSSLLAAIQMNSGDDVDTNIRLASELIAQAAAKGAKYVVLPEYFYWMGADETQRVHLAEAFGDGPLQRKLSELAATYQLWLAAGTLPIASPEPEHVYNTQLLFNPQGQCQARYDKVHLFGYDDGSMRYQESDVLTAGRDVVTYSLPFAKARASVCYDLRFPELYRQAPDYQIISMAAAFTYTTGLAHWHTLLQARAIENQCYVVAAAQTGEHLGAKQTYGHSLIVDPWGEIVSECPAGNGVVVAAYDPQLLATVRQKLPALAHRML
ncbi:carbon-nitrogen hydrolase family protein [Celerinatantimonas yamalensis]|uniref:Carbon-nitrogen hydrolase family protein n=1 Tax=Celerinatantimonas yamalensis TaxID=559956 RepID=A0ABW9GAL0_9GAMM